MRTEAELRAVLGDVSWFRAGCALPPDLEHAAAGMAAVLRWILGEPPPPGALGFGVFLDVVRCYRDMGGSE
jgi:hypothetical protein